MCESQTETVSEGGDSGVDPGVAYVQASRESIATTPVEGTTIIDIVEGFRVGKDNMCYSNIMVL